MTAQPTTNGTYVPRANSKQARLLDFFRANPDEELTADDISDKFDMPRLSVHTLVRPAVDGRAIQRSRNLLGEYIYRAGPALATTPRGTPATPAAPTAPQPQATPAPAGGHRAALYHKPRTRKVVQLVEVDLALIDSLPVDTHVPLARREITSKWDPLFRKLTQPGESVAIPIAWHRAVSAEALKRNRQATDHAWRVRQQSDTQARLYRIAK